MSVSDFAIFQDSGRRHLRFVLGVFGPSKMTYMSVSIIVKNLVSIDAVISIIWTL